MHPGKGKALDSLRKSHLPAQILKDGGLGKSTHSDFYLIAMTYDTIIYYYYFFT